MELLTSAVSSLRHPLHNQLKASAGPGLCAQDLREVLPIRHLDALTPASEWCHHNGELALSHLPIAASVGSPYRLECDEDPLHRLVIVHDGRVTVTQDGHSHHLKAGDGLILPGDPWTLLGQNSSTTTIGFDPLLLLTAARNMAPAQWTPPSPVQSPLRCPLPLPTRGDDHCAALLCTISLELPAIHQLAQLGQNYLEGFLLHEQLYRLIAALIFPELRHGHSDRDSEPTSGDRRLDRLLDYISLHLTEPLPLSVLESQSHYSRRSLHYAFQERFGCSPMQWIRQQRMQMALQRLQNSASGVTVASVAVSCGYRSQSRFRIDFERAYGRKPSAVLRGAGVTNGSSTTSSLAP